MYISDRLNYKTRDDLIAVTEECPFEWLFIEAEVDKKVFVIGTVYKPPDTNVHIFNEHFNDLLRRISKERKKCIIMADFNIDLLKIDTNGQTTDFIHGMFASAFYPTISRPNETENIRAVVEMKMEGKRPRGRPKLRWYDTVRRDLKAWKIKEEWATDREGWRRLCKTRYPEQGDGGER